MDADTAIGGPDGRFPSTHVSLIEAAASGLSEAAMDKVIALYWKPVYRFIRIKFQKSNEDAKDLTQGFFASALQRDFFPRFDPTKASFRTYIRMAVERYAANQHGAENRQKRGGGVEFETVEDQEIATESPELEFDREWRRQLFFLALDDLRAHCEQTGKRAQFSIFEDYDLSAWVILPSAPVLRDTVMERCKDRKCCLGEFKRFFSIRNADDKRCPVHELVA